MDSILEQTFRDFEFIIIDDASTDATPGILSRYARGDSRIRIISNDGYKGLIASLNCGIRECSGEYIARMDADDIAVSDRLEKQIAAMDANPDIWALGGALTYIDACGNELGVVRHCDLKSILTCCPLLHPTVFIRRNALIQNNLYYLEKYRFAEDYFLWLQISKKGKISAINDVVLKYRLNDNAAKIRQLKKILWATLKVKKDAIFILRITPTFKDLIVMLAELILFLAPKQVVLSLYLRKTFGKKARINL